MEKTFVINYAVLVQTELNHPSYYTYHDVKLSS